ncbi:MAG: GNAT family N-acetyltransferase [Pirellulales bacterium]|nr:GNAT family N-acetyltransferase [Pirellulales bacterium]
MSVTIARTRQAAIASQVEIVPVRTWRQKREFLNFPWKLYADDPHWIPPLRLNQKELAGYAYHPFYDQAEAQTFLARRDGKTVGRISAIVNHAYAKAFPNEPLGFFGFFESIDDQQVATALLDTAREWLAARGLDVVRGPVNPSMNYECGLLVDGFDSSPTFMMTYNPPYYARLLEEYGFHKAHDLLGYIGYMDELTNIENKLGQLAEQIQERFEVKVRPLNRRRFMEDVRMFLEMYNSSMVFTWGFVPISDAEVRHFAKSLRFLLHPQLTMIADVEGRHAGVVLCLPDYNPRIKEIDGRLLPFGFLRLLSRKKDIHRVRVVAINVLPEFQRVGLGLVLMRALAQPARDLKIAEGEFSWVLETNELARLGLEKGGARIYKTWRMYDYRPEG